MRRIITALLVLLTTSAIAQNGGQITGKKNNGLTGTVMVDSVALKVSDSASRVYLSAMKLKSDSIYRRMYQDSVNLAKLGTGVTTTLDSTTQRSTIKINNFPVTQAVSGTFWQTTQPISGTITTTPPSNASSNISQINGITPLMGNGVTGTGSQRVTIASDNTAFSVNTIASATDSIKYRGTIQVSNFPATQPVSLSGNVNTTISGVAKKTLGTQVVSADTGLVVNAVMHGLTTGGGGGYVDVKVNPSGALTVEATLDSATQRSTIKVIGHDSTTDSRLGVKLLVNPTITNDSASLSRTTIKVSNFPTTQAVSGSVTTTLDSTTQRGTIKISNFPATQAVSGTFYQATQPVSIATMPSTPVTGTFWQTTQPVSFTRLKSSTDTLIANLDATDSTNIAGINSKLGGTLTVGSHAVTNAGTFAVQVDSATQRGTFKVSNFPTTQAVSFTRLKSTTDTVAISGSITATAGATAIFDSTWSSTSMTVTSLNSLASSATVGWQSDSVRNNVRKAVDYKINVKLTMANTAPANDKAVYVYICPFYFDGTNWYAASQGTTTLPTGAQGASTIASPNNLRLLGVLSYTTQNQVCQDNFLLSNAFGNVMPDGFSIIIVNFSGAAVSASGNVVNYSPINKVQR